MTSDKINVQSDARITHESANLRGRNYHYLFGKPDGEVRGTIFLIHGWPDLSMGWRYQIPLFLNMGLQVVCPDLMGFGRTDAPSVPPESLSLYGFKQAAADIKELATQLGVSRIILGGHDWGGLVIWRTLAWQPELVTHAFSVCTPYLPPSRAPFIDSETLVKTRLPNFSYQLHLASGEVEKRIKSRDDIRALLNGLYGGSGPNGEVGFNVYKDGPIYENLEKLGPSRLLSQEELDYYANEYARHGIHSTLNWYRTRETNYKEELELPESSINIPCLFIAATKDAALPPAMSQGMERSIPDLTRKEVEASHWALWEAADEVNRSLQDWFQTKVFADAESKL